MPYPTQITRDAVIDKARALIEAEGLEQVSLSRLAAALNVKAPSLYRYFESKNALLQAVNNSTLQALRTSIEAAVENLTVPHARVMAMAQAYRAFGHRFPVTYGLLYGNFGADLQPDANENLRFTRQFQEIMSGIAGDADSLAALCGAWALTHGFIVLELNNQFRLDGDRDATFTRVLEAYIAGWE